MGKLICEISITELLVSCKDSTRKHSMNIMSKAIAVHSRTMTSKHTNTQTNVNERLHPKIDVYKRVIDSLHFYFCDLDLTNLDYKSHAKVL